MIRLLTGDCREIMKTLAAESVDAIVTDPPYHLTNNGGGPHGKGANNPYSRSKAGASSAGFMGMKWDGGDVAFDPETWRDALRVLKPGGHLLAFGGSRTYHRLACAIEDAGFEIRDQIMWLYGSGFPKSHNGEWGGTALKPAHEPIVMARKPLIGTVAANALAHGTGALNIDGCRVLVDGEARAPITGKGALPTRHAVDAPRDAGTVAQPHALGRWPANVIHDGSDEVVALFPTEAGAAAPVHRRNADKFRNAYGSFKGDIDEAGSTFHCDSGSAARFFYCAKADRADRDDGCDGFEKRPLLWSSGEQNPGSFQSENTDRAARNNHPTVKPTDLMAYLCRLVTPPGGTVLDPFMGSGSTGRGALAEGFDFIGIELDPHYVSIAKARIRAVSPLFAEFAA